jgi:hypothetical protein
VAVGRFGERAVFKEMLRIENSKASTHFDTVACEI